MAVLITAAIINGACNNHDSEKNAKQENTEVNSLPVDTTKPTDSSKHENLGKVTQAVEKVVSSVNDSSTQLNNKKNDFPDKD